MFCCLLPHISELWVAVYRFMQSHAHLLTTDCGISNPHFPTDYLTDWFIPIIYASWLGHIPGIYIKHSSELQAWALIRHISFGRTIFNEPVNVAHIIMKRRLLQLTRSLTRDYSVWTVLTRDIVLILTC